MKDIFDSTVVDELEARIAKINPETHPVWGKMSAPQMFAHLNVAYEMTFDPNYPKSNFLLRFLLRTFLKNAVCGPKPYRRNSRTAPQFIIKDEKNFEIEKARLIAYLRQCSNLGRTYFEGKENRSFGIMSANDWNGLFYKHLNHHLTQFGV